MNLRYAIPVKIVKALNVVMITAVFALCWYLSYGQELWRQPFYARGNYVVILGFVILYCWYCRVYNAFWISLLPVSELIYSQALAILFSDAIMYVVTCLLSRRFVSMVPILLCVVGQMVLASLWAALAQKWHFTFYPPKNTAVIYDQREGKDSLIKEYGMEKFFKVVACCSVKECFHKTMEETFRDVKVVYLCGVHSKDRNVILKYCVDHDISTYVIPRVGDLLMNGAERVHMFHLPLLRVDRYTPEPEFRFIKRLFDIVTSGIAIILLSPVMLITAIAVKSDGGPVLYKQVRLTRDGKEFKILKFRSMRVDAEKDGVARLSTGDHDDRITKVGRFIRKVRIDELPQLFNIFLGDMSVVGPRPERPEIAKQYEEILPEFRLRLQVKAGLTGYAQVYGKYNTTPYDKLKMDLMYLTNAGLVEDLKICFATVKILFLPESTEGIGEGQTTAMTDTEELGSFAEEVAADDSGKRGITA